VFNSDNTLLWVIIYSPPQIHVGHLYRQLSTGLVIQRLV